MGRLAGLPPLPAAATLLLLLLRCAAAASLVLRGRLAKGNERPIIGKGRRGGTRHAAGGGRSAGVTGRPSVTRRPRAAWHPDFAVLGEGTAPTTDNRRGSPAGFRVESERPPGAQVWLKLL